jgi:hypothetical protein
MIGVGSMAGSGALLALQELLAESQMSLESDEHKQTDDWVGNKSVEFKLLNIKLKISSRLVQTALESVCRLVPFGTKKNGTPLSELSLHSVDFASSWHEKSGGQGRTITTEKEKDQHIKQD